MCGISSAASYPIVKDKSEDISQEVFVFFIEHSRRYDAERGSLFSFLCGIARNRVFAHLKKSGTRLEVGRNDADDFEDLFTGGSLQKRGGIRTILIQIGPNWPVCRRQR